MRRIIVLLASGGFVGYIPVASGTFGTLGGVVLAVGSQMLCPGRLLPSVWLGLAALAKASGPVFGILTETIRPTDTSGELLDRLAAAGAGLLVATLDGIAAGALVAHPQSDEGVSHAPKLEVEDARVSWAHPALAVDRLVRACTPAPGAWTTMRGERLRLGPVTLVAELPVSGLTLAPGGLLVTKNAVYAGTATTAVRLGLVRPQGKKEMGAPDWARGVRIQPGERLGVDE